MFTLCLALFWPQSLWNDQQSQELTEVIGQKGQEYGWNGPRQQLVRTHEINSRKDMLTEPTCTNKKSQRRCSYVDDKGYSKSS